MTPMSKRRVVSSIVNWIVIAAIAAVGAGLNFITPYHRPFSLVDLNISFPLIKEQISTTILVLVGLVAPAIIIILVALLLPVPNARHLSRGARALRFDFPEVERGLAGLGLSIATAFFITQAMKQLFGKPRPSLLARCQPDLTDLAAHIVGSPYGDTLDPRWVLVDVGICTNPDLSEVNDGFRSFPSGHSSFSWSGLLYLSLFLCLKFRIVFPSFLPTLILDPSAQAGRRRNHTPDADDAKREDEAPSHLTEPAPMLRGGTSIEMETRHFLSSAAPPATTTVPTNSVTSTATARSAGARGAPTPAAEEDEESWLPSAPTSTSFAASRARGRPEDPRPMRAFTAAATTATIAIVPRNYLLPPVFVPIAAAVYICSTRYVEFYHFGFDIISGALIGIGSAAFAFRWYYASLLRTRSEGEGWRGRRKGEV